MSQLAFLLISVTILLLLSVFTSEDVIISPQFGFTACFIPGICYAFYYVKKWNLYLSNQTIIIIILGITVFIIVSAIVGYLDQKFKFKIGNVGFCEQNYVKNGCISDSIAWWKMGLVLMLEVVSLLLVLIFLIRNFGTNISAAIYAFRLRNMNIIASDYLSLPEVVRSFRRIALSVGYVVMYLFFNGIIYNSKKNRITEIICIILAFLNGIILGGRGEGIQLIIAGIVIYFFMRRGKEGKISIRISDIIKVSTLAIIIIATFAGLGTLLGRQMDFLNFNDYIAVYLSAELKNLDIFIRRGVFGTDFKNSQTMMNVVNTLGSILGHQDWIHDLDNPYHYIGSTALGNVSTIFYAFMYDGGYIGVIGYTILFAIISQLIFQRALRSTMRKRISFSILLYSYVWYTVVFSFFSDKFYEIIFSTAFIWTMLSWIVFIRFFNVKVKVKLR